MEIIRLPQKKNKKKNEKKKHRQQNPITQNKHTKLQYIKTTV